ncbi:MAG: cupin domain-containing protein [Ignavibacteria bacterium]|nr:cupin domain-containing protein [Ignavibacteria bacterium]
MIEKAEKIIKKYKLQKHIEGGYFTEFYRSHEKINQNCLPKRYKSVRVFSTSIYFLLKGNEFSTFHKLNSDEILHFYDGCPVNVYLIDKNGNLEIKKLGRNISRGENYQILVKAGNWLAIKPTKRKSFSLIGCTVAPGFEYDDLHLGKKEELLKIFPKQKKLIEKLTIY